MKIFFWSKSHKFKIEDIVGYAIFPDAVKVFVIYHKDKRYPDVVFRKTINTIGIGFKSEKLLHAKLKEYGIRKYQN
jgi:hypothetical protein